MLQMEPVGAEVAKKPRCEDSECNEMLMMVGIHSAFTHFNVNSRAHNFYHRLLGPSNHFSFALSQCTQMRYGISTSSEQCIGNIALSLVTKRKGKKAVYKQAIKAREQERERANNANDVIILQV